MNKLIRLSPTGIEYGDYAWNFASGCGNQVDGKCRSGGFRCWAYSISQRFGGHYPNGFEPTIYPEAFYSPLYLKKPSRILCAFMGDLFWDCPEFDPVEGQGQYGEDEHGFFTLMGRLYDTIEKCPQHTFLFLTKQPQKLPQWSPFPDNCSVGVTATDDSTMINAIKYLKGIVAGVKYINLEPYLQYINSYWMDVMLKDAGIKQLIIGAQTRPAIMPEIEWVREIIEVADKAGVPVFLKNNLRWPQVTADGSPPFYRKDKSGTWVLRQEMPV
ncbi:MAG: DUF5131 family protein [Deltaproteobacteria bacterium]|nr:DUF5131 family protein [Deltaproteobacteria bacterium]